MGWEEKKNQIRKGKINMAQINRDSGGKRQLIAQRSLDAKESALGMRFN